MEDKHEEQPKLLLMENNPHSKLVKVPAPELRQRCEAVDMMTIIPHIPEITSTMLAVLDSCRKSGINTISISAPQIGFRYRCFMIDSPALLLIVFNPVITRRVGEFQSIEGCLSFRRSDFYSVPRAKIVKFHYTGVDGMVHTLKVRDRYAAIVQHEIDHLDGILMDDNGLRCGQNSGR